MSLDFEIILKIEITYEFAGGGWHYDTLFSRVPRRLLYKTHIYTHIYARYAREFQNMVSHVSLVSIVHELTGAGFEYSRGDFC